MNLSVRELTKQIMDLQDENEATAAQLTHLLALVEKWEREAGIFERGLGINFKSDLLRRCAHELRGAGKGAGMSGDAPKQIAKHEDHDNPIEQPLTDVPMDRQIVLLSRQVASLESNIRDSAETYLFGGEVMNKVVLPRTSQMLGGEIAINALLRWMSERDQLRVENERLVAEATNAANQRLNYGHQEIGCKKLRNY